MRNLYFQWLVETPPAPAYTPAHQGEKHSGPESSNLFSVDRPQEATPHCMTESVVRKMLHIPVLDGWRGICIVLVLLGPLFPLATSAGR